MTQRYKGVLCEQLESVVSHAQLYSSLEEETEQKTRQQNKTQGSNNVNE